MNPYGVGGSRVGDYVTIGIVGIGVVAIAYFGIIRPTLKTVGIIPDKKAIKNLAQIKDYKGFDPTVYDQKRVTLSPEAAKELASQIYNSVGNFNDDEEAMLGALQQIGSYNNLSYTSKVFYNRYQKSLGDYIGKYYGSASEVDRIKQILMSYGR